MLTETRTAIQLTDSTQAISQVIDLFTSQLDTAETTRQLYRRTVLGFFDWVASTGRRIDSLTVADLIAYKQDLQEGGKSSLTVASYINSLRRFYEWAESVKIYPNIAKGIHAPKRKQQFRKQPLTLNQVGDLIQDEKEHHSKRDQAIINLLVRTGLRTIEIVRANVGDLTYRGGKRVLFVQGKGRTEKDNFVIITDSAFAPLREYLETRGNVQDNEPLFTSESNRNNGGRLTTRSISGLAKQALREIGLNSKEYTAHSLRHTTAVNILRAGGSLEQVQYTLRHSNPGTTQIYTATLREEQRLANSGETLLEKLYATM